MLDKLLGKHIHLSVQFIACLAIAIGLPWSKVPLSLATVVLAFNLIQHNEWKTYWGNWKNNRFFIFFVVYFLIQVLSLCWTSNFQYALHDLNIKIALLALPLCLVAIPLKNQKQLIWIALAFIGSCLVTSIINTGNYYQWWGNKQYDDIRGLSLFASHIRYALEIVFALVLCIAWVIKKHRFWLIAFPIGLWFVYYTYIAQVISGYFALVVVAIAALYIVIRKINKQWLRISIYGVSALVILFSVKWVVKELSPVPHKINLDELPLRTKLGNEYFNDSGEQNWENGYPVIASICEEELELAWNKRSKIDYLTGKDMKNYPIFFTLWRYMASKGLTKDAEGMQQMTPLDIQNVEHGIASILLAQGGFKARLYGIRNQIEYNDDPNGHSLLQRIEYWKIARHLIQNNLLFGVGIGDVDDQFKAYYTSQKTLLREENQHRAHNQFFTTWITSGILGALAFLIWWIFPLMVVLKNNYFEWLSFIGICMSSFLTEDTLETQVGVVFVAFFFGLFISSPSLHLHQKKNRL